MKEKALNITAITAFVFALLFTFVQEFFGLEFPDTFYYIGLYSTDNYIDAFHLLSQGLYCICTAMFGDILIAQRLLNYTIYLLGILLLCLCTSPKKDKKWMIYLASVVTLLCIPHMETTRAFNGNGLTLLFLACSFISIQKYLGGKNMAAIWLCISCTLCILSRFPNIILIPFILLISPLLCKNKKEYLTVSFAALFSIPLCLGVYLLVYGSWNNFIVGMATTFAATTDATAADHSMAHLIKEYLHSFKDMVSYIKYLSIFAIIPFLGYFFKNKKVSWILIALSVCAMSFMLYYRLHICSPACNWFVAIFVMTNTMLLCLITCILSILRSDWKLVGFTILPMLISFCSASGSDGGLTLMQGPMVGFFPFVICQLYNALININKREVVILIGALVILALCAAIYVRNGLMWLGAGLLVCLFIALLLIRNKHIKWIDKLPFFTETASICMHGVFIIMLLTFSAILLYSKCAWNNNENHNLCELRHSLNEPKLYGIHSSEETAKWINDVMTHYRTISPDYPVVFYGITARIFPYLANSQFIQGLDFTCRDECKRNVEAVQKIVNEQNPVFFLCPYNPGRKLYSLEDFPTIEAFLFSKGYSKKIYDDYAVYYPNNYSNE